MTPTKIRRRAKSNHRYAPSLKLCVSGAAQGECLELAGDKAIAIGREIARVGAILTHGATTGIPQLAAKGCKLAGGTCIGFSPASTSSEHTRKYRLPLQYSDLIIFTGSGYAARNLLLTRSSDAVIIVCGRIGTLNEFTVAFEDKKVIGVLDDSGGITKEIRDILKAAKRGKLHIVFEHDPKRLVAAVIREIKKGRDHAHYPSDDQEQ
ncbi:MAG: hypothetical protein G01um101431_915 [Parcubacteria group bacterium Gr01-1014_31]|nr:MAG: hypothetical protein G01um101431_915 [Parcubacteria group bacterium Gr01-1014_31]